MENFPTPTQLRVLPWATNICTLVVMVAATWWSSVQCPTPGAAELFSAAATVAAETRTQIPRQPEAAPAPVAAQTAWPVQTHSVQTDAVKTVGYTAAVLR